MPVKPRLDTLLFASVSEFGQGGDKFVGTARLTVHNVGLWPGLVRVVTETNWPDPLTLALDVLLVNP